MSLRSGIRLVSATLGGLQRQSGMLSCSLEVTRLLSSSPSPAVASTALSKKYRKMGFVTGYKVCNET